MRIILSIILLVVCISVNAQYKYINFNKTIIRYDSTVVNETYESVNDEGWLLLRLKSNGDTLAAFFDNGNVWTKATVIAGNITADGSTTMTMITLPSTIGANAFFLNNQVVYRYAIATHEMKYLFSDRRYKPFVRKSENKTVALFHGNGCKWIETPATRTLIAQGIVLVIIP